MLGTKALLALSIVCLGSTLHAQALPEDAKPSHRFLNIDNTLLAYDAIGRALDVWSTNQFLGRGVQEAYLPAVIVDHPMMQVAYSAAVVGGYWFVAHELRKSHHKYLRILADAPLAYDGTQILYLDIKNFEVPQQVTPPVLTYTITVQPSSLKK